MAVQSKLPFGAISADSHTVEPPHAYRDYMDPKYRDDAPFIVMDDVKGACYAIKGFKEKISIPQTAWAGLDITTRPPGKPYAGIGFEDLPHPGGWDPTVRLAAQDHDGVIAEVLYPTIGMALCGLSDHAYQNACMQAYNRWLQDYISFSPRRLFGIGQTAVRSVDEAVQDLHRIKEMGFKGVMLPGDPGTVEDYDHPSFDKLWETAVELDLPLSFHILTGGQRDQRDSLASLKANRGQELGVYISFVRGLQDIITMFIFGQVFDRHPKLKIVLVEADASWAPHWMHRADHAYNRLRKVSTLGELQRSPSETFRQNVYMTFGDDWPALKMLDHIDIRQLLWANDYPHTDAIWPDSQRLIAENMNGLSDEQRAMVLRDNVNELYSLGLPSGISAKYAEVAL